MIADGMISASADPLKNSRLSQGSLKNKAVSGQDLSDLRGALVVISDKLDDQLSAAGRPELTYDLTADSGKWSDSNPVKSDNLSCLCNDLKELVSDYNGKRP
jgi:hypothetical protein